jgi:SAM-dependent methyltransferase
VTARDPGPGHGPSGRAASRRDGHAGAERALLHRGGVDAAWGNLGLWLPLPPGAGARAAAPDAAWPDYASAAAALARAVAVAAGLGPGQRVLAPGCGWGEEMALWVREFGVAHVLGIERDAQRVLAAPGATPPAAVECRTGDALRPDVAAASFDAVLCVDAAYHLAPRARWLGAMRRALRHGGRLAFTDLVLDRAGAVPGVRALLLRPVLRLGAAAAGIDADDLVTPAAAAARLAAAGFADVRLERLDEPVLGGFVRFAAAQTRRLGPDASSPAWRRVRATAALLGPCRAAGLGYALLSATAA